MTIEIPILSSINISQLVPGDENCENFAFVAPKHTGVDGKECQRNPKQIIRYNQIDENIGASSWTCPICGTIFEVFVPLNSEMPNQSDY
jgi:hypothetical protein